MVQGISHSNRSARSAPVFWLGGVMNQSRPLTNVVTTTMPAGQFKFTNKLAREKSPYLLQHQHNPVDWLAWGDEAFSRAIAENKPIFLSIGYSTCHWCHVMERESFENEEVAGFLNRHFVSIKVDREERPDVDKIYMTFVQATSGGGGWPLNVFLTPDRKPLFGGTYFPPDDRHGRPGFLKLLRQIADLWKERRAELAASAEDMHDRLEQMTGAATGNSTAPLSVAILSNAAAVLKSSYDHQHGGFGGAPKFPQPSQPRLLLRCAQRFQDEEALGMVLNTCDAMARGGIHDQLGGGFARYAVDAEWLVPHFEKMLYDNAQLVQLYLDAFVISGEARFADVARDILEYVLRDMTHPEGGFYSAEDADSEGHEGKFYCWTQDELAKLLTPEEFKIAVRYFGVTPRGNFVDHSHPQPLEGQNVLSIVDPNLPEAGHSLLAAAKAKMLAERARRIRPHLDDKTLASWNGLMLGAFARAGAVLDEPRYGAAAEKNLAFIREKLWDQPSKTLYHRWRDGERDQVQLLESYAFLLSGVVELYSATLRPESLVFAVELADAMIARFYDPENGGFWQSTPESQDLILRLKEDYDGAEPSGNAVAILSLLELSKITERADFAAAAEKSLQSFAARLEQLPQAVPYMLQALDFHLQEPRRAVIAGRPEDAKARALIHAVHAVYQPNKIVLGTSGPVEAFAKTLPEKEGALAYICKGTSCQAPTDDPGQIQKSLLEA